MKAEIITIGTEIMLGSILNTNVAYLSRRLMELGIETLYHTSVDDDYERVEDVLSLAMERADIILTTGGLGPTDDDLTKEALASATGRALVSDINMVEHIKYYFAYSNREMTLNNLKQAMKPEGAEFIENPRGTAPGIFMEWNNKKIVMMPGPPREMEPMFENRVIDLIKDDHIIIVKSINTCGLGESTLETQLKKLDIPYPDFSITTYAGSGSVEIKVIGRGRDKNRLERESEDIVKSIRSVIGEHIYGYGLTSIEDAIIEKLIRDNWKIAVCESVTGGSLSRKLTGIPGASKAFDRGLITYSNNAKIQELGISSEAIEDFGAVSEEVSYAMAKGLFRKCNADIVVSTTGYAGPDSDPNIKTGLIYVCIMTEDNHEIYERVFSGDRNTIQERASNFALWNVYKFLNKKLTSNSL